MKMLACHWMSPFAPSVRIHITPRRPIVRSAVIRVCLSVWLHVGPSLRHVTPDSMRWRRHRSADCRHSKQNPCGNLHSTSYASHCDFLLSAVAREHSSTTTITGASAGNLRRPAVHFSLRAQASGHQTKRAAYKFDHLTPAANFFWGAEALGVEIASQPVPQCEFETPAMTNRNFRPADQEQRLQRLYPRHRTPDSRRIPGAAGRDAPEAVAQLSHSPRA